MSQTLQYKGYDGSVEYSAEDRILHGSLLGIRDAIVYEGTDVDSLESNFRAAVDEYLACCAEEGKSESTEETVYFHLDPANPPTMTPEQMQALRDLRYEDIDLSDIPELPVGGWRRVSEAVPGLRSNSKN